MKKQLHITAILLITVFHGLAQTPYLLKDIINGPVSGFETASQYAYYTHPFEVVWEKNGIIFFTAVNYSTVPSGGSYVNDVELWRSDGTTSGTVMVKDINPGNEGSYPADFIEINGLLYFTAYSDVSGRELWKTDGTNGGTSMVKEIISGNVGGFQEASQYAYYSVPFSVLWQNGGYFYFVANNYATVPSGGSYTNNIELWKSDGTDAGTVMVKDINGVNTGSEPRDFHVLNGMLFFTARQSATGRELWKSDGTYGGTIMVKEIISGGVGGFETSGQYGYYTHNFNVVWQSGITFYFTANNYASTPGGGSYTNNIELWKSDGTDAGTVMVKDIEPGNTGSDPRDFTLINGILYFTARTQASGRELWRSDGTNGGTFMVKEIINGAVGGFETAGQYGYYNLGFGVVWQSGNNFFFIANNYASVPGGGSYTNNQELWKSDGTGAGTMMVKDIQPGNDGSDPLDFTAINNTLYFTAHTASNGRELWRSDGTNGGTIMVKEIIGGPVGGFETAGQYGYYTHTFSVVWQTGGTFYFVANNYASVPGGGNYTNNPELWKSDGTDAGTVMVKDIYAGNTGSYPQDFRSMGGLLYFTASESSSGRELWRSDGTNGGTYMVREIMNGAVGGFETASQYAYYSWNFNVVFNIGSYFYFTANDYASVPTGGSYENNIELWRSDGTYGGTTKVMEIHPSATEGSYPAYFTNRLGKIFFTAVNVVNGRELWAIDYPLSDGLELTDKEGLLVFPNPGSGQFTIQSPKGILQIIDNKGALIYSNTVDSEINSIDLSGQRDGQYLLRIITEKSIMTKRIVLLR